MTWRAGPSPDWNALRARLARSVETRESDHERDERVLRERAAALARPRAEVSPAAPDSLEVLTFQAGREAYAVATEWVVQALPMPPLTSVPGVPNHVAGIVPFRGAALAVLDLRSLLGLPVARLAEPGALVALAGPEMEFALLVDAIGAVRGYPRHALQASLPGLERLRAGCLLGVAPDRTAILDAGALLADPALLVEIRQ
jgi:purine-binding chemotaxis protein CheW